MAKTTSARSTKTVIRKAAEPRSNPDQYFSRALEKGLQALQMMGQSPQGLTLTAAAQMLGLTKASGSPRPSSIPASAQRPSASSPAATGPSSAAPAALFRARAKSIDPDCSAVLQLSGLPFSWSAHLFLPWPSVLTMTESATAWAPRPWPFGHFRDPFPRPRVLLR